MKVITRTLSNWPYEAWLVELPYPITVSMVSSEKLDNGVNEITNVSRPSVRYVVVAETDDPGQDIDPFLSVYPAYASGEPRRIDGEKWELAGGRAYTFYDALDVIAKNYDVVCDLEGERTAWVQEALWGEEEPPEEVPDYIHECAPENAEYAIWCSDGDWGFAETIPESHLVEDELKESYEFLSEGGSLNTVVLEL